ncbi:MAG: gliding motility-associated C-terminal domain-containing protein [Burkholderiales bacterium]|nr:gliding motility-associated C-terminal domain-containing protein [Bacteroidia bacterium]
MTPKILVILSIVIFSIKVKSQVCPHNLDTLKWAKSGYNASNLFMQNVTGLNTVDPVTFNVNTIGASTFNMIQNYTCNHDYSPFLCNYWSNTGGLSAVTPDTSRILTVFTAINGTSNTVTLNITPNQPLNDVRFTIVDIDGVCNLGTLRADEARVYGYFGSTKIKPSANIVHTTLYSPTFSLDTNYNFNTEVQAIGMPCVSPYNIDSTGVGGSGNYSGNTNRGSLDIMFNTTIDKIVVEYYDNSNSGSGAIGIKDIIYCANWKPITINENNVICENETYTSSVLNTILSNGDYDPDLTALSVSGTIIQNPSNGSFNFTSAGNYTYTPNAGYFGNDFAVVNICDLGLPLPNKCSYDTIFFKINPLPTLSIVQSSSTICNGNNLILTASGASTYTWSGGVTNGVSFTPTTTSMYSVIATNTITGCTKSSSASVIVNPVPDINPILSPTICSGSALNISITSTLSSNYTWLATDNGNTTGESISNQITALINDSIINNTGSPETLSYTVTPQATLGGCFGAAKIVAVTVNPRPQITNTNTGIICSNEAFSLNLTSTAPSTYTWVAIDNTNTTGESINSQTTAAINDTILSTSLVPETVTYNITPIGSAGGCVGISQIVTVTINPTPLVTVNTVQTLCNGSSLNIVITSNANATTYNWGATSQIGVSGATAGNTSNTINDILTGVGFATYTVVVTTAQMCSSLPLIINVNVSSGITITSSASKTICSGTSVNQIITPAFGGISYSWIANNNPVITGESLMTVNSNSITDVLDITTGGQTNVTYTVIAVLKDCPNATQIVTVTINPLPTAFFTINDDTLCQTACVNLVNTSTVTGGTINGYLWDLGDGTTSTNINPIHCYPNAGNYTISLIATSNNNCKNTNSSSIPLIVVPNAFADFNFSPSSPVQSSTTINFSNNSINANTFNWNYGDGNTTSLINPTYSYSMDGNFSITLIAYNQWGCNDTIKKSIEVQTPLFIPTAFTPDGDPKNETFVILGIENYPNNELKVFNRWGNLVYSKKQYDNSWAGYPNVSGPVLGTDKLPASTYYYILEFNKDGMKPVNNFVVIQY